MINRLTILSISAIVPLILIATLLTSVPASSSTTHRYPRWGVFVYDLISHKLRYVANLANWSISPNGKYIVGGLLGEKFYQVSVVPVSGGHPVTLARFNCEHATLRWSADSQRVTVDGVMEGAHTDAGIVFIHHPGKVLRIAPSKEHM